MSTHTQISKAFIKRQKITEKQHRFGYTSSQSEKVLVREGKRECYCII